MRGMWVLLVLVACKPTGPCGDAIDESFARTHARRQTEAREHPERRQTLLDEQLADDESAESRRAFLVKHCANDDWGEDRRKCVAKGDVESCLSSDQRAELDRVDADPDDMLRAFTS